MPNDSQSAARALEPDGDTKSTEQLAKNNGTNANKENTRLGIETELPFVLRAS